MKAMIFAAGLGTRLKPLTDNKPKALIEINGKTLLERSILNLRSNGITEIIVNIHHFPVQMTEFINELKIEGVSISISDERDELLETGGGLLKARELLKETNVILLINVDILTDLNISKLIESHQNSGALATLVVRERETSRYLLFNSDGLLCGWKNVKTGAIKVSRPKDINGSDQLAFSGIQVISTELFDLIEEEGKFSIIDLYLRLAGKYPIKAYRDKESNWMDLGKIDQFAEAERIVRQFDQADRIS